MAGGRQSPEHELTTLDAEALDHLRGTLLGVVPETHVGRYRILRPLAAGGMGEVFLAEDPEHPGRPVAIKRLHRAMAKDPALLRMFQDEARIAVRLDHPNLVRAFASSGAIAPAGRFTPPITGPDSSGGGGPSPDPYLVMEYVEGPTVAQVLRLLRRRHRQVQGPRALRPPLAVQIAADAAAGLEFAHALLDPEGRAPLGVVHRDISPDNILLSLEGQAKVADFGVAKAKLRQTKTAAGQVKGKLPYMSPEQCLGGSVDPRSDVFSLGVVLYEMLLGTRPFSAPSAFLVMERITRAEVLPLTERDPQIDPALSAIVLRALAKKPSDRYGSAADFGEALEAWRSARGSPTPRAELAELAVLARPKERESKPPVGLPRTAPERTIATPSAILTSSAARHPPSRRTNLTADPTSFFGRERELARIHAVFGRGARLVTLWGPGGTGKTRVARRFGALFADQSLPFSGGVWFCDLTSATTWAEIVAAVASTLGVEGAAGARRQEAIDQLGYVLAERGHVLLILDNFEQLTADAAATVGRWLALAPEARFLVTSRELLRLGGEHPEELGPLPIDAEGRGSALQLFLDRVAAVRPGYELTPEDAPIVAELLRQLECIPLAIELAASRMALLSPAKILERLSQGLAVLSRSTRDASHRHATLAATIEWSWRLLDATEQSALIQCSVFRGGFTVEAAEAVLSLDRAGEGSSVLDVIQSLRDKSLLRSISANDGRLGLYEVVREFAEVRLKASGLMAAIELRHAHYYAGLARGFGTVTRSGSSLRRVEIERELPNLLVAHARVVALAAQEEPVIGAPASATAPLDACRLAAQIALATDPIIAFRGPFELHRSILEATIRPEILARLTALDPLLAAYLRIAVGRAILFEPVGGRLDEGIEQALDVARAAHDRNLEASVHAALGGAARMAGDVERAFREFGAALRAARELGDLEIEAEVEIGMAGVEADRAAPVAAREHYRRATELYRAIGDQRNEGRAIQNHGLTFVETGELDQATRMITEASELFTRIKDRGNRAITEGLLAVIEHIQNRQDVAILRYTPAIHGLLQSGYPYFAALYASSRGAALAHLDLIDEAERSFAEADRLFEGAPASSFTRAHEVLRGVLDLAHSRRAKAAGDSAGARAKHDAALARLAAIQAETAGADARKFVGPLGQAVRIGVFALQLELSTM